MGRLILGLISAALLVLAFPRFEWWWWLAWVGLAPLLAALHGLSPAGALGVSWPAGMLFFMALCAWINQVAGVTPVHYVLMGIYLGGYWAAFGLIYAHLTRVGGFGPVAAAPALWVSLDYLRTHAGFLALPWGMLGQSQYQQLPVIQIASLTGVYGVTFIIVMVNAALAQGWLAWRAGRTGSRPRPRPPFRLAAVAAALALAGSLAYGYHALLTPPATTHLRISLIQGNIPQERKWDECFREEIVQTYRTLTLRAVRQGKPHLIVWPESALPGLLLQDTGLMNAVVSLVRETKTPLVLGSAQRPKIGPPDWAAAHRFNSVFLITPAGEIGGVYHKMHLLPFGEYLPYRETLPWPAGFAALAGNFVPGREPTLLSLGAFRFAAPVCWETLFPHLCRRLAAQGAAFMVNLTNEAWFGDSAAPWQFLMMNVFRAVENGVALARAANTGISCLIDPTGRIVERVRREGRSVFVEGILTGEIPLSSGPTFYARHGDWFAQANVALTLLLAVVAPFRKRRW
ncbi:MAG: apolipoprotein N-acyltransferase [Deltaproteobacteria bacterium]|nr:apolipoprotein N-acyltransferase [Deltaproteobacteria bacterium]